MVRTKQNTKVGLGELHLRRGWLLKVEPAVRILLLACRAAGKSGIDLDGLHKGGGGLSTREGCVDRGSCASVEYRGVRIDSGDLGRSRALQWRGDERKPWEGCTRLSLATLGVAWATFRAQEDAWRAVIYLSGGVPELRSFGCKVGQVELY